MDKFLTILLLSLMGVSKSIDFCDFQTFDVVFNVGKGIHMIRCGEVWNYDHRLYGGSGGFTKDYSWFGMARKSLGKEIIRQFGMLFDETLHFAAWSFQDIKCEDPLFDLERDCEYSASKWNTLSFMAINHTIISFWFDVDFEYRSKFTTPFKDKNAENLTSEARLFFWPNLTKFQPTFDWEEFPEHPYIYSALFAREDYRLFLVLLTRDGKYFCITHINMKSMIFDYNLWPKFQKSQDKFIWAPPYCFIGNVVGMFVKDGQPYIVGRVLYESREYEDQVYAMKAGDSSKVEIEVLNVQGYDHPLNLRTFFGCPINKTGLKIRTESATLAPEATAPEGRKRRSIDESETTFGFNWENITTELRDDWFQLSVMSFAALFLLYIIFRLCNH